MPTKKLSLEVEKACKDVYKKHVKMTVKELEFIARKLRTRYESTLHEYNDFAKLSKSSFFFRAQEVWGGARLPLPNTVARAKKSVAALEKAIKTQDWRNIPKAVKNAEIDTLRFLNAQKSYWHKVHGGGKAAIKTTRFLQTAGFMSLGVVCVTFAGGPLALAVCAEGSMSAATVAATSGGVLSGLIKSLSKDAGRAFAGENVSSSEFAINAGTSAFIDGLWGLITGPFGRSVHNGITKRVINGGLSNKVQMAMSRLAATTVKKVVNETIKRYFGDYEKAIAKKALKYLKGTENKSQLEAAVTDAVMKDPAFQKRVQRALEEEANFAAAH